MPGQIAQRLFALLHDAAVVLEWQPSALADVTEVGRDGRHPPTSLEAPLAENPALKRLLAKRIPWDE